MDISEQSKLAKVERKQFTGVPLKIMKLLGQGILPAEAARACGVSESYVSQLKADPDFTSQVSELVEKTFKDQSEIDENYVETERVLSKRLRENAGIMFNQDTILRTLKFVNEAKKKMPADVGRAQEEVGGSGGKRAPVVLIMPEKMIREFTLNPNNEIVGIGETPLVTLPSGNINNLVAKHHAEEKAKKEILKLESKDGSRSKDPWSDL